MCPLRKRVYSGEVVSEKRTSESYSKVEVSNFRNRVMPDKTMEWRLDYKEMDEQMTYGLLQSMVELAVKRGWKCADFSKTIHDPELTWYKKGTVRIRLPVQIVRKDVKDYPKMQNIFF